MKKLLIILLASVCVSAGVVQRDDTNAKIKAVFLYNFTKYIEWPASYKSGNFIIGVYGNNPTLNAELIKMSSTKSVGSQKFEIRSVSSMAEVSKCHILFVNPDQAASFNEILGKLKGKSTLLVTEKNGLAKQGAAINFVVQDNKQKFELNKSSAEKHNLKVSTNLLSLAIVID